MKSLPILNLSQLGVGGILSFKEERWAKKVTNNLKPELWRDKDALITLAYKIYPNLRESPSGKGYVR